MPEKTRFNLHPGRVIAGKYEVVGFLGKGQEGEVYRVEERVTGLSRAAKIFYPERNPGDRALRFYARKLDQLRGCSLLIHYHHTETARISGQPISVLVSELVEGDLLKGLIDRSPGRRLPTLAALLILRTLAEGLVEIHDKGEYHGDLHEGNVLIRRRGIQFEAKLVDIQDFGRSSKYNRVADVCDLVRILYEMVGGKERYAEQPPEIRAICLGLKKSLISRKFPTAGALCRYLDEFEWTTPVGAASPRAKPKPKPKPKPKRKAKTTKRKAKTRRKAQPRARRR
jgi:serine/threonine protein kinase